MRSHALFEPIVSKICMWGQDAKFYGNQLRGFGVTGPPKRHFLYLTLIALTTVSALPCCTVICREAPLTGNCIKFCMTNPLADVINRACEEVEKNCDF